MAGRVAIITGASSGIGRALAPVLAREGYAVGLVARRRADLEATADLVAEAGGTAAVAPADVGCRGEVREALACLARQLGPIDLVVANAGLGIPTSLDPMNLDEIEATFRVNLLGLIYTIEAALPAMLARRSGHLVGISSLSAYRGFPGESAYCASKAAVNAFLEGLRVDLRDRGVAVTTICPGFVATPMTAITNFRMPWLLTADAAALKIARAIRRRKKVYNFPLPTTLVVKLIRHFPDWLMAYSMKDYEVRMPDPEPKPDPGS